MTDFIDRFPDLPQAIDLGGDKYFMGPQKPIELGFKNRKNYIDSFGDDRRTEYLLRRYMYYSLQDKRKLKFDEPKDKSDLITILKKRAKLLEASKEFTSSTLKNTLIQRSFLNIQKIIQELEGPEYKGVEFPSLPSIPNPFECKKAKNYVKQIPEDRKFRLMLQIAWYLLHPDKIPSKVECSWSTLLKELDTLRLGDIVSEIRKIEEDRGGVPSKNAFNYFKKINIQNVAKSPTIENALEQAKKFATEIQGNTTNDKMKERLRLLLEILEMKKYLANDLQIDEDRMKIIDTNTADKIKRNMIMNPMSGGASKTLDKPIGIAMKPFFDYFKEMYDPIYSLIDSSLAINPNSPEKTQKVVIPLLTTLLYICNNLKPSETTNSGANTYGIYKIINVDSDLVGFINNMFSATQSYLDNFKDDSEKNVFNQQLFKLPKVRLSSLLNKILNSSAKDSDELPYIQFLTVGGNLELMPKDTFMNSKYPEKTETVFNAINDFFTNDNIYILCTKSDNSKENIPMNVYEIDFSNIDVSELSMKIDNIPDNYFNKNKVPELYLEKLVTLMPYVVFNDAELALSIFIAFKELMPK
jgi:hypothetical protein